MVALCAACVLAYWLGLGGDFLFDDYPNITLNPAIRAAADGNPDWFSIAFTTGSGLLRRPLSMLSFGLNAYWFGMEPLSFKAVNVVIHLLNGLLLWGVFRRLTPQLLASSRQTLAQAVALVAAGIWLLHPLHVSSVLYIVQRMNLLATLFMLAGLLCYAEGRVRMCRGEPGLLVALSGLCTFGLLAVFCKENGVLIVPYALAIELCCFRFAAPGGSDRRLRVFFWLTLALPLALFAAYLASHPAYLAYARNGFTLPTRLLSEARVVCDYLLWTFIPLPSFMGMYHDDIAVSAGLFTPATTALSISFLAMLGVLAWRLRNTWPALTFGVFWFAVGHSLESTILPLELVFEHRNYLPMAGPLLAVACLAAPAFGNRRRLAVGLGSGIMLALAALLASRTHDWRNALALALSDVANHPESSRSQYEAGRAIAADGAKRNDFAAVRARSIAYMEKAAELDRMNVFPGVAQVLLRGSSIPTSSEDIHELAVRLRNAASNEQANPFLELLVTASNGKLALTPAQVATLFEAADRNPRWRPQVRAMMYNDYGAYRFNIEADHAQGVSLTQRAAEIDPVNAYFELNLAKMALVVGDRKAAAAHLDKARKIDILKTHESAISSLQQQIGN